MRVLVLSGGGSKGAFQLGVLSNLFSDPACHYDAVFGVSTGALTGAVIAQGSTRSEQKARLRQVIRTYNSLGGNSGIYRSGGNIVSKLWNLWRKGGMFDPAPLVSLIKAHVDPQALYESKTFLGVGYTHLANGRYYMATGESPVIRDYILASASQPIFFQLSQPLGDGGCRNQTPLGDAFSYIKDVAQHNERIDVDVIVCNPVEYMPQPVLNFRSASQVLLRTLDIIENEVFLNDLKRALRNNTRPDKLCANIHLYAPAKDLGDGLDFNAKGITDAMLLGFNTPEHSMTKGTP
jgi:NTE family protein